MHNGININGWIVRRIYPNIHKKNLGCLIRCASLMILRKPTNTIVVPTISNKITKAVKFFEIATGVANVYNTCIGL